MLGTASRHTPSESARAGVDLLRLVTTLRFDISAFDLWCRSNQRITLPASSQVVADYLKA